MTIQFDCPEFADCKTGYCEFNCCQPLRRFNLVCILVVLSWLSNMPLRTRGRPPLVVSYVYVYTGMRLGKYTYIFVCISYMYALCKHLHTHTHTRTCIASAISVAMAAVRVSYYGSSGMGCDSQGVGSRLCGHVPCRFLLFLRKKLK